MKSREVESKILKFQLIIFIKLKEKLFILLIFLTELCLNFLHHMQSEQDIGGLKRCFPSSKGAFWNS